jgi:hypothetical protein
MAINVRDDDRALLEQLCLATRLGRITEVRARGTSRAQVCWSVGAKSDCLRLAEILESAPLRGRKSADFDLWHGAVHAWVGEDARLRRPSRCWDDLEYLAGRLKNAKRFGAAPSPSVTDPPGLEPDWAPYLAGFLTAEGHFSIARADKENLRPTMRVNARADDRPLLEQLARRTAAVGILDGVPPAGKKGREYAIWREAVRALSLPKSAVQPRLAELREALLATRAYPARNSGTD